MNIFTGLLNLWNYGASKIKYVIGTQMQTVEMNGVTGDPSRIATVYTACKILSDNLSRMPISIFLDNGTTEVEMKRHRLTYLLKYQPNDYQNSQQFWSTVEYHRNKYGNAFVRIYTDRNTGRVSSFEIIHPGYIREYDYVNGQLVYTIINFETQVEETILATDMLHFRGISEDGVIGLSPLVAIERQTNINERATATIDHFYENNATSPMALETELPGNLSGPAAGALKATKENFEKENVGPTNAGKWVHLPVGTKLKSIAMQFADAKLIQTLRFTREDIGAAYGLPLFMLDGTAEKVQVDQLSALFKNNTMGPIVAIYTAELNSKLLTRAELEIGFSVLFDVFKLISLDYSSLVTTIKDQVVNGLMTPNEGTKKLHNRPIPGPNGNKHYLQAQYIPLEDYDKVNPLIKNDPTLKTKPNEKK